MLSWNRLALHLPGGHAVAALTAVMVLDTADQSAIGATAPAVREAFGISQAQIGLLATSSTLVGAVCALPFGVLADRARRIRLLRWSVAVWIVAMLGVGSAPNFAVMLVCHAVLGLVTGAGGPLIASMIGDLVPAEMRGRVFSALLIGELAGSVLGLSVAGEIAALIDWRWAFWLLAASGVVVYLLLRDVGEPPRQHPSGPLDEDAAVGLMQAVRILVRNRTIVLLVAASALGYYFFAGVQTFSVSLLRDDYGASASIAPLLVLAIGLSLGVGVLIGGPAGDRIMSRRARQGRLPLLVVASAGWLGFIVPALASRDLAVTMPLLVCGGVLLGAANPALDATRLDIVPGPLRGRAEAVRTATRDGADALAPVLFGVLAGGVGLQRTFLVMTVSLAAALGLCLLSLRSYPHDIEIAQGSLAGPP